MTLKSNNFHTFISHKSGYSKLGQLNISIIKNSIRFCKNNVPKNEMFSQQISALKFPTEIWMHGIKYTVKTSNRLQKRKKGRTYINLEQAPAKRGLRWIVSWNYFL